jgi:prolyl oligopeptidase
MMAARLACAAISALALVAAAQAPADPYRELEDSSQPKAQAFYREQGERAREALDALPGRAALLARIDALSDSTVRVTSLQAVHGSRVFYLKRAPGQASAVLCMREKLAAPERVLVDPARFSKDGAVATIDWFRASPDGSHVAYGVSSGGDDPVLRVVAADGRDLPIAIDHARFNEHLAWHPDGRSFFYARLPRSNVPGKRYANVRLYRHVLGRDGAQDEIVFASGVGGARDVPEFVRPWIYIPPDSKYAYAVAREGVRRELDVHVTELRDLASGKPHWRKAVGHPDAVLAIEGWRDELFLLTHRGAGRHRILRMKASGDVKSARVAVPEGESVIESMALAKDALYLQTMVGGIDRLERVAIGFLGGLHAPEYVKTPFDTTITQLVANPQSAGVLIRIEGWIEPPALLQVDANGDARDTHLIAASGADYSGMDEVRLYAPAADGARIPVTLIYKKGTTLTGLHPTILEAFGSYGVSVKPNFDEKRLAWLERGGVYAVAHIRGGGEFGETWYESGRGPVKANTISDFISASDFLVRYGFTSPRRLGALGARAGAIPVGGAINRRPELYAAAVARAPFADLLRYEAMANGPAQVPEFGSAANAESAEVLRAISPLHNVRQGAPYPGVMVTARLRDWRTEPWQAGKWAARLQEATGSGKPVLLRVDAAAGQGRRAENEERADIYSFFLWQMSDPGFQPPPPPFTGPPAPPAALAAPPTTPASSPDEKK